MEEGEIEEVVIRGKWKFEGFPWVEKWKCAGKVEGVSLVANCPIWGTWRRPTHTGKPRKQIRA